MHVSNMKIRPQVMHRVACIDCGQVGGLKKSAGTPRQPSDFKANCTVSMTSAGDKCWASGRPPTCRAFALSRSGSRRLFARRTRFLPDEKTRRPTRLSGHFGSDSKGTCNRRVESQPRMPITRQAGAAGRNRTCDPLLRREMLYPLSYSRAVRQCSKGGGASRSGPRGPWLAEATEIAQVSGR